MNIRGDIVLSWANYDLGTIDPRVLIRWAQRFCTEEPGEEHDAVVVRLAMLSPDTPRELVEEAFGAALAALGEPFPDDEETWRTYAWVVAQTMLANEIPPREATKVLARLAKERDELSAWTGLERRYASAAKHDDVDAAARAEAAAVVAMLTAEPA